MKRGNTDPPVKVGDKIEVSIEAQGAKGDGIAKIDGYVLFVPNAKIGQTYEVTINRVFPNMGFAEIPANAQPLESNEFEELEQQEEVDEGDSEEFGEEDEENN